MNTLAQFTVVSVEDSDAFEDVTIHRGAAYMPRHSVQFVGLPALAGHGVKQQLDLGEPTRTAQQRCERM